MFHKISNNCCILQGDTDLNVDSPWLDNIIDQGELMPPPPPPVNGGPPPTLAQLGLTHYPSPAASDRSSPPPLLSYRSSPPGQPGLLDSPTMVSD